MNFVIFSRNFYPQNDPEAYCTTRFASALAECGHNVSVVTVEHPKISFIDSYLELVHPRVRIVRVPISEPKKYNRFRINFRYLTLGCSDVVNFVSYIKTLNEELDRYDSPILISRAHPLISHYIAWYCRRNCRSWIAHFSDPIHWEPSGSRWGLMKKFFEKIWIRRVLKDADMISVTCKRAVRYYKDEYGSLACRAKWMVVPHIGDNKLDAKFPLSSIDTNAKVIVHHGDMYSGRGSEMVDVIEKLNTTGFECELIQDRKILDNTIKDKFDNAKHCHYIADRSEKSEKLRKMADGAAVSLVLDFNGPQHYSPFLMSKFVYQIFTNRPLVVISKEDSEKHDLCNQFPKAGLFFAQYGYQQGIMDAMKAAFQVKLESIDRSSIREMFSSKVVARNFLMDIMSMS